jgi:hypothetical protein
MKGAGGLFVLGILLVLGSLIKGNRPSIFFLKVEV